MRSVASAVHGQLLARHGDGTGGPAVPVGDDAGLAERVLAVDPLPGDDDVVAAVALVRSLVRGLGLLDPLLADDEITEVMVNGDGSLWTECHGRLHRHAERLTTEEVMGLIERVTAPLGVHADRRHPIVDARLTDGSRVHAIIPPLAVDGPCLTIRRFRVRAVGLADLCPGAEVAHLLVDAVVERRNLVVSGGTSAGKTTLLNALAACLPAGDRVVTIEDTAELRLPLDHVVRLEARPAAADGVGEVPIGELVRAALRMRPDRIVVGEVRGGEALAMLQAMNTGHEGSLTTCHANSPVDALRRIETMAIGAGVLPLAAVREQVRAGLDLVVQVRRGADGRRQVVDVGEVEPDGDATAPLRTRALVAAGRVVAAPARPARRHGGGR